MVWRPVLLASLGALALAAGCGGGGSNSTETSTNTGGSTNTASGGGGTGGTGGTSGTGATGGTSTSSSTGTGGAESCTPGEQQACYTGPFGTEGVGICHGGMKTCAADGKGFGDCVGEVLPAQETCATLEDDDCDGKVNEDGPECVCIPGSVTTCYSGPMGTEGVGLCIAGILTCNPDGKGYGPCMDEVTPKAENCATPEDEDCDGLTPPCPALWDRRYGDLVEQFAWGLAVDGMDNVVITGDLFGAVDFGGGVRTSAGLSDVFLTKLDANGGHLWSKVFGNNSLQSGQAVAVDANGNVAITGYFQGSVTFGTTALATAGLADIFVAKFDANGNHVWSKKFGSATDDQLGLAVAFDPAGNVLVTGALTGTINFGGGNLVSAGGADVFVLKLDAAAGNHLWSKKFGDVGVSQTGRGIAADAAGDVYVTGDFDGTVNFGGTALTTAGGSDIFVARLAAANGAHVWSKAFGDADFQIGRGITVDAMGNVIVVGELGGSVNFGGGAIVSKGATDAFVVKLDSAGAHLASVGFGGPDYDSANAVSARGGAVSVTGYFTAKGDFGGKELTSAGGRDVFTVKLDGATLGTTWARGFGDVAFYQSGQGVGLDSGGNTLVSGFFFGNMDFGNGPLMSVGNADVFVAKIAP